MPPTIRFLNLQLQPEPTDSAKAAARSEADSVLQRIRDDSSLEFEDLARQYSDGPSASDGGELGWIRRDGSFVEEFEDAAFVLSPGMVSVPVETDFGFHLIYVERRPWRGSSAGVRHILFQPEITETDIQANLHRADGFRSRILAGEDIEELSAEPVDTLELTIAEISQISLTYAQALRDAEEDDVLGPLRFEDPQSPNTVGIVRVLEIKGGGALGFEDVRDQIEARLKSEKLTEEVVEALRSRAFIDIRLAAAS